MTSMWMVQNERGNFLDYDELEEKHRFMSKRSGRAFWKPDAETMAISHGGHLVEMVPAKPKVPVSQEEAELIDGITNDTDAYPASGIHDFVVDHFDDGSVWPSEQFRLMEAAINGYTVTKPTKYNVKVPHLQGWYYYHVDDQGNLLPASDKHNGDANQQFTIEQIKHYGLQDCERVEISTEDSND